MLQQQPPPSSRAARRERRLDRLRGFLSAVLWMGVGALGTLIVTDQIPFLNGPDGPYDPASQAKGPFSSKVAASGPARTIYLHRGPITLTGGRDAAHDNRSSVVHAGGLREATLPGFSGTDRGWRSLLRCVEDQFAAFGVAVTDVRPQGPGYAMVVVSGRPADVGVTKGRIGGLAPFDGGVIPNPVVFAFAHALHNEVRALCETIAMEVAHAYGLDHSFLCEDVMSYGSGCGEKRFLDKGGPCGEKKTRSCASGQASQNSYQALLQLLGPSTRLAAPLGPATIGQRRAAAAAP